MKLTYVQNRLQWGRDASFSRPLESLVPALETIAAFNITSAASFPFDAARRRGADGIKKNY